MPVQRLCLGICGVTKNDLEMNAFVSQQESLKSERLPTLAWVRKQLRNNFACPLRVKVLKAAAIGSVARGCPSPSSDLDIAVVIPVKRRISALQFSERYHQKLGRSGGSQPSFHGRSVDFQFFYPSDAALTGYSKVELV